MEFPFESIALNVENECVLKSIRTYVKLLLDYNLDVNLISRRITPEALSQLLNETILLNTYIECNTIIDAGSGNGILGIPIAFANPNKKIILVEPKKKKSFFLRYAKEQLNLNNLEVKETGIEEYLKNTGKGKNTLISRGFPNPGIFAIYLGKMLIHEAIIITSENKIKKMEKNIENILKKTYNVPLRNDLKILKIWRM